MTGDKVQLMDDNGGKLLETLVFAYSHGGVTLSDGTFLSAFCGETPHSILHGYHHGRWNNRFMGRCTNYNSVVPETFHMETKRKARKIRNHCTVGRSTLQIQCRTTWMRMLNDTCLSSMTKRLFIESIVQVFRRYILYVP
jgi:hypothetical protein